MSSRKKRSRPSSSNDFSLSKSYPLLCAEVKRFGVPPGANYKYGTAGFRMKVELLPCPMYRVGLLAALLARHRGKMVGIVVTASHNLVHDNGAKVADWHGGMLEADWEERANAIVQAADADVVDLLEKWIAQDVIDMSAPARVALARDTRPSGAHLCHVVRCGIYALGGTVVDCGEMTTPQLHYVVRATNIDLAAERRVATEQHYYEQYARALAALLRAAPSGRLRLLLDAANGVGAPKMRLMALFLREAVDSSHFDLRVRVCNDAIGDPLALNRDCGAEHVQKKRQPAEGVPHDELGRNFDAVVSIDGDCDRVVLYTLGEAGELQLLDGDKIMCLIVLYVLTLLAAHSGAPQPREPFTLGVVQTAYANGASGAWLRALATERAELCKHIVGPTLELAKTGVKHVHHRATKYDIGVYFEANGHGTVLFSDRFAAHAAARGGSLAHLCALMHQGVGDACSDMLVCCAALAALGWSMRDWQRIYTDLPSAQSVVVVRDRTLLQTCDDESRLVEPQSLQARIDAAAQQHGGRAFVRPSGTEDVVRTYCEAPTRMAADGLEADVCAAVEQWAAQST